MPLRLYRGNRVESLLKTLLDVMAMEGSDPFIPETVMVQNPGMAIWLQRNMAAKNGICAGIDFLFPRRVIQKVFAVVLGEEARELKAYDPARLLWMILSLLETHIEHPELAQLARYLKHDPGDRKRVQLAQRIAGVFDEYALYRPQMVVGWEHEEATDDWQAILWREMVEKLDAAHVATLTLRFTEKLMAGEFQNGLPKRLYCFGVSTLPPLYVHVLGVLAEHIDVHFFSLAPSPEYYGDISSERQIDRTLRRHDDEDAESLHLEVGHPLLASLGQVGKDFQAILEALNYQDEALFEDPGHETMLRVLQSDMYGLVERGPDGKAEPIELAAGDTSIQVHSCHTPMREVEVLRDQILDLFETDESLKPSDVVVMMPDVEDYAPLIEAVFGVSGTAALPFSIADRNFRGASPAIDAFFRVIDLSSSRMAASEVLDLLALPPIHERFGMSPDDVEQIGEWVSVSGIRWGIDAKHRARFGQPETDLNTWRFGLRRLLLGFAMPHEDLIYEKVLPRDQIEGMDGRLLGRFMHFCDGLFKLLEWMRGRRKMASWQQLFLRIVDMMIETGGDNEWQAAQIRMALDNLVSEAQAAEFDETLDLVAVRQLVEDRIEYENEGWNFLSEGMTFCAMVPMRSIPFRVVAMIGMNETDFPRQRRPETFDKMAEKPLRGDRSRRNEERYLFLEALLAARERVIISYVGQDIKDNSERPPSVVVSELLDVLSDSFLVAGAQAGDREAMLKRLILKHPMQGFNPLYFDALRRPELFSYSDTHFEGAKSFVEPRYSEARLFTEPLKKPETVMTELELDELIKFFSAPVASLLRNRLGFDLREFEQLMYDREPLELQGLEKYQAGTALLERALSGLDLDSVEAMSWAEGCLPLGTPGHVSYEALQDEIIPLVRAVLKYRDEPLPPLPVNVVAGDMRLTGHLQHRYEKGLLWYQYQRLSGKQLMSAWIRHLAMCVAAPTDQSHESIWLGRGEHRQVREASFAPVENAAEQLANLVELYRVGQSEPLLFFPKSSWAYAKEKDEEKARKAGYKAWKGTEFQKDFAECMDPHYARVFGDENVTADGFTIFSRAMAGGDFVTLARRVFDPLKGHLKQGVIDAGL